MLHLTRAVAAWGFTFQFASDDARLVELVGHCYCDLPPAVGEHSSFRADRNGDGAYDLSLSHPDGSVELCSSGRSGQALIELLVWEVNRRARASMDDRTVLHAAVIGGPAGVVMLCGGSGAGKSTLCAAAALRGWQHLSDDLALVDVEHLAVVPYARPLMMRRGGRTALGLTAVTHPEWTDFQGDDWFLPASELGAEVVRDERPLVAVCVLRPSAPASIAPLNGARTLQAMTEHSATLAARGGPGFDDLVRVAERVPGYSVVRGEAADVLDLLTPLVGQVARG